MGQEMTIDLTDYDLEEIARLLKDGFVKGITFNETHKIVWELKFEKFGHIKLE